jgi:hypothetical protein
LAEVKPEGSLRLAPGDHRLRFISAPEAATSPRAEVTVSFRGAVLPNSRRPAVSNP